MNQRAILITTYLQGEPASHEILNDFLEESSCERIAIDGTDQERFSTTLDHLLLKAMANGLACDFAEHTFSHVEHIPTLHQALTKLVADIRSMLDGKLEQKELLTRSRFAFTDAFAHRSGVEWRVARSVWAAAVGRPSHAARSAQRVDTKELAWQISHTIETLSRC